MLNAGHVVTLTIEKPAAGGRMIARAEGQVVLVAGAIPGEQVTARIERVGRGVAYAEVVAVQQPSPDRQVVNGDPLCGGCLYSHIGYTRQLEIKALVIEDAFARIGHITLPVPVSVTASPEDGYRMRARLHVRGGQLGFFTGRYARPLRGEGDAPVAVRYVRHAGPPLGRTAFARYGRRP